MARGCGCVAVAVAAAVRDFLRRMLHLGRGSQAAAGSVLTHVIADMGLVPMTHCDVA